MRRIPSYGVIEGDRVIGPNDEINGAVLDVAQPGGPGTNVMITTLTATCERLIWSLHPTAVLRVDTCDDEPREVAR